MADGCYGCSLYRLVRMVPAFSGCPVEGLVPNGPAPYQCPSNVLALYKRNVLSLFWEC